MAKPDKTDLLNASVALSMNAWAKSTVDLNRHRESVRRRTLHVRILALKGSMASGDRQLPVLPG